MRNGREVIFAGARSGRVTALVFRGRDSLAVRGRRVMLNTSHSYSGQNLRSNGDKEIPSWV